MTEDAVESTPSIEGVSPLALTRWSYLTVPVVAAGFEDAAGVEGYHAILNEYGSQGWELVRRGQLPGQVGRGVGRGVRVQASGCD